MSEIEKNTQTIEFKTSKFVFKLGIVVAIPFCLIFIGFLIIPMTILNYKSTSLILGKDFLIFKSGWIAKKERKISFAKINSVDYSERLAWKMYGKTIGEIKVYAGNDTTSIDFKELDNPKMIADLINERIKSNLNK